MSKGSGKGGGGGKVSGHTHDKGQLDHYANQHNPNNSAYQARMDNHANQMNPNNTDAKGSSKENANHGKK